MKEYNRYLIKVYNIKEARRLLNVLKDKSNIKWENGLELDNEYILNLIYGEVESVGYLAIRGNVSYWLDEEEYFQAPEEFKLFDFYNVNNFIDKVVNNMEKKIEVKDLAIIASDDKYGEKLLNFLDEFTAVKFNSGDALTSKAMADIIREYKDRYPKDNLIFVIRDNRMYTDMYYEEDFPMYKAFLNCAKIYDSVREFLLSKDEWIIK